jgi:TPR repeat protein
VPNQARERKARSVAQAIWYLAAAVLAGSAAPCQAKLGETPEQIEARYGRPIDVFAGTPLAKRTYRFEGYGIGVIYLNGVSVAESLEASGRDKGLSDQTCLGLASALTGKTNWVAGADAIPLTASWSSKPDCFALKTGVNGYDQLTVYNSAYSGELEKETKAKDKALFAAFGSEVSPSLPKPETNSPAAAGSTNALSAQQVEQAKKKAMAANVLKFHRELADAGDPYGEYKMGLRYLKGDGVEKDEKVGRDFLKQAAAHGFQDAVDALAKLPKE